MAMYIFTSKIINNEAIPLFNNGDMKRDFTYIDDIVYGTRAALDKNYKYEIFNLGNHKSERLKDIISLIEKHLSKKAKIKKLPIQPGDVKRTFADIEYTTKMLNFFPKTSVKSGIPKFIDWYKYYNK